jgi:hypothetical protein
LCAVFIRDYPRSGSPIGQGARAVVTPPAIPGNAFEKSAASQKMTGGAIKVRVQHLSLRSL